jgi:hypothetical protein
LTRRGGETGGGGSRRATTSNFKAGMINGESSRCKRAPLQDLLISNPGKMAAKGVKKMVDAPGEFLTNFWFVFFLCVASSYGPVKIRA